jgi:hypothetical protein
LIKNLARHDYEVHKLQLLLAYRVTTYEITKQEVVTSQGPPVKIIYPIRRHQPIKTTSFVPVNFLSGNKFAMSARTNSTCAVVRSLSKAAVGGSRSPALRGVLPATTLMRTYYSGQKRPDGSELPNVRKAERLRMIYYLIDYLNPPNY